MEPKFIELHNWNADPDSGAGDLMSVNVEAIQCFHPSPDVQPPNTPGVIEATDGSFYTVTESYEEIKQLIHDSGILIHRADPRLDETHPLTMADLKEMIGEPVWNSNNGFWYLVNSIQTDPDGSHEKIILRTTKGRIELLFDEDELIKFPLYRMRRGDYERGRGSMSEEEAEVIWKEIVKNAELRMKLGVPPMEGE